MQHVRVEGHTLPIGALVQCRPATARRRSWRGLSLGHATSTVDRSVPTLIGTAPA